MKPAMSLFWRNGAVWLALLLLLASTAGSAYLPLGRWNGVVNLSIAVAKAGLVAMFYMHLREAGGLVRLAAVIAVFMLLLMLGLAGTDYLTRIVVSAPWQVPAQLHPLPKEKK